MVVCARTVEDGDHQLPGSITSVVRRITDAGGTAHAVRCDLSSGADREALVEAAVAEYGPVDILVNNAAVTFFIPTGQFPEKRYKLMEEVQVYGPLHLTQLVLASMRERKTGWVVNVSSHAALHPKLDSGGGPGTVYGMCKAALERFSTGLAAEVNADGVSISAISPGLVGDAGRRLPQADHRLEPRARDARRAHGRGLPAAGLRPRLRGLGPDRVRRRDDRGVRPGAGRTAGAARRGVAPADGDRPPKPAYDTRWARSTASSNSTPRPGPVGRDDDTVLDHQRLLEDRLVQRPLVRFLDQEVRRASVDLNGGGCGHGPAVHVRRDHRVVRLGHAGDLLGPR